MIFLLLTMFFEFCLRNFCLPCESSKSLIILISILRSKILQILNSVRCEVEDWAHAFHHTDGLWFQRLSFPLWITLLFLSNINPPYTGVCMDSLVYCTDRPVLLPWCQYQTGLIPVALVLKAKSVSLPALFLLLQECFDYSRSFAFLHSHISYNININLEPAYLFLFLKSLLEFDLNYVELWISVENFDILTILDFPPHQYGASSHSLRSSLIFLSNVL